MQEEKHYRTKFVAFIDVLGMKDAVKRSEKEGPDELGWLFDNVCDETEFLKVLKKHYVNREDFTIKLFSDSMYFSYPEHSVIDLLEDISDIALSAANVGYYFRGGITFGKIYEDGNILYGPAMVEAYRLESKVAIYPRIVIDSNIVNNVLSLMSKPDERLLTRDKRDRLWFLNYLMRWDKKAAEKLGIMNINLQYKSNFPSMDQRVREKELWMIDYFNSQVDIINDRMNEGTFMTKPLVKIQ